MSKKQKKQKTVTGIEPPTFDLVFDFMDKRHLQETAINV